MNNKFHNTVQFVKEQRDLLTLSSVKINDEGIACLEDAPLQSSQFFTVRGKRYFTQILSDGQEHRFQIWSQIGVMPYSAENPEYRKMLLNILKRSREQKNIQLIVSKEKNIVVFQEQVLNGKINHFIFMRAILRFLAQSMYFVQIIQTYSK